MSSRKLLSPLLIGALLLAAVVVYLNLPAEEQVKKGGPLPTTVKTILVEQGEMAITIEAPVSYTHLTLPTIYSV